MRAIFTLLIAGGLAGAAAAQVDLGVDDPLGGGLDTHGVGETTAEDDIGGPVLDEAERSGGDILGGDAEGLLADDSELLSGEIEADEALDDPNAFGDENALGDDNALDGSVGDECGVTGVLCE
jgi:hypothetical protein